VHRHGRKGDRKGRRWRPTGPLRARVSYVLKEALTCSWAKSTCKLWCWETVAQAPKTSVSASSSSSYMRAEVNATYTQVLYMHIYACIYNTYMPPSCSSACMRAGPHACACVAFAEVPHVRDAAGCLHACGPRQMQRMRYQCTACGANATHAVPMQRMRYTQLYANAVHACCIC
jgi:hypothetical protein